MKALRRYALAALLSGSLLGAYVHMPALWWLGFGALTPWLIVLHPPQGWRATLALAWLYSMVYALACLGWFGLAMGRFTEWGTGWGLFALLVLAPALQPQILVFMLVRRLTRPRYPPLVAALTSGAAWVAVEWLWPKLLGDTLGQGLVPAEGLRLAAAWIGTSGLTLLLLWCNEAWAELWLRARQPRPGAWKAPLTGALAVPLVLASLGALRAALWQPPDGLNLKVGLIQTHLTQYEKLRAQLGTEAAARLITDTHFSMSYQAVEHHGAEMVMWTETAYPTTLGHPKSAEAAALDQQLIATMQAAGVPFVLGTYDRDALGEYNAAAVVNPKQGLTAFYRKTRLFWLTESVPTWLDGPWLDAWLPWAGRWQAGHGARVLPLVLASGQEIPALPLICLDEADTSLALDGARQGAQVLLSFTNDSWFDATPTGRRLHLALAQFRSIESGLPQFRVTPSGVSVAIDPLGRLLAMAPTDRAAVVVAAQPVGPPLQPSLMVRWGDWVSLVCTLWLMVMAMRVWPWPTKRGLALKSVELPRHAAAAPLSARVLQTIAQTVALLLALAWLLFESWRPQMALQRQIFVASVVLPQVVAWLWAWRTRSVLPSWGDGDPLNARQGMPLRLQAGLRFGLLPLALALPAFLLHQQITHGEWLGDWHAHGGWAYLNGFTQWWLSWLMGVTLCAALLRLVIECLVGLIRRGNDALGRSWRTGLEWWGWALLIVGMPAWLIWRTW